MSASLPSGTVTFLFTDVESSTRLWEEHGEAMRRSLTVHDELLAGVVEDHGGSVFKHTGDGLCAVFGSAASAVAAAVAGQDALARAAWGDGPGLRVRMGVHTGEARVEGQDYFGQPVNRVARIMAAGHGGQVLLSGATEALVRGASHDVELLDLGEHRLRDLSEPERLFQAGAGTFPQLRTLEAVPNNLPAQLSVFVGRRREMDAVHELLGRHRLVTLTGVGGTGKTRLAIQSAAELVERFPDGVFLVELATVSDPAAVADRVESAVGGSTQAIVGGERPEGGGLTGHLRDRSVLLVLDNCEHLVDASATLAEQILRECPGVHVLATSREALGIVGEQVWRVPSMGLPDDGDGEVVDESESVLLLVDRARLAEPGFALTEANRDAVAEVCRRLDGIPLAIELAAARVATLGADEVVRRLNDQFRILTGGSRTALERHQTLRAAIDWSFDLLSEPGQALFPRLAVFNGGWTLDACERVCSDEGLPDVAVLDALTELVDKSLVILDRDEAGARYRMVEPVRQYARERFVASGEVEALRDAHAAWLLDAVAVAGDHEADRYPLATLTAMREYPNVVDALHWLGERGRGREAGELLAGASISLLNLGVYREALQLVDQVLAHEDVGCWCRYMIRSFSGYYHLWQGDLAGGEAVAVEARRLAEECPEVASPYSVDLLEATIALNSTGMGAILDELERVREEAGSMGNLIAAAYATFLVALARQQRGDFEGSIRLFDEVYAALGGSPVAFVPYVPALKALSCVLVGDPEAGRVVEEGVAAARRSRDPAALAYALVTAAWSAPLDEARAAVREAVAVHRKFGIGPGLALAAATGFASRYVAPELAARLLGRLELEGASNASRLVENPGVDFRARLRDVLGDEAYEAARAQGASLDADELLDLVVTSPAASGGISSHLAGSQPET